MKASAKLPADLAVIVMEVAVRLAAFTGDSGKKITEVIKDYDTWVGKVNDCRQGACGVDRTRNCGISHAQWATICVYITFTIH